MAPTTQADELDAAVPISAEIRFVRANLALVLFAAVFVFLFGASYAGAVSREAPVAAGVALTAVGLVSTARRAARALRQFLWRISRKLVVSYLLIAFAPLLFLGLLGACFVYLATGQLMAYMAWRQMAEITHEVDAAVVAVSKRLGDLVSSSPDLLSLRRAIVDSGDLDVGLAALRGRFPNVIARAVVRSSDGAGFVPPGFEWPAGQRASAPSWLGESQLGAQLVVGTGDALEIRGAALRAYDALQAYVEVSLPLDDEALEVLRRFIGMDLRVLEPVAGGAKVVKLAESRGPERDEQLSRLRVFGVLFVTPLRWSDGHPVREGRLVVTERALTGLLRELYEFRAENRMLIVSVLAIVLLALVGFEIVSLGVGLTLARSITGAVDELFEGTQRIERGDFLRPIPVRSEDQLGALSRAFNSMSTSVATLVRESAERERLEEELRIGRAIQQSLLPASLFHDPRCEMAAFSLPAKEVGGDYYDFFRLGPHELALLVADVSGKGTQAAFYMAEVKGIMLALTRRHAHPREVLSEANALLAESLDRRTFVTMTYAMLDLERGILELGRAGHSPMLLLRAGENLVKAFQPAGLALGLDRHGGFAKHLATDTIVLESGDTLLFFTDGVTDTVGEGGEFYGQPRLEDAVIRHRDRDVEGLRDALVADLRAFAAAGPLHDDVTFIVLRVLLAPGNLDSRVARGAGATRGC